MSRHVLRQDDVYTVVVGYDDTLDTYFAQVYDATATAGRPDADEVLLVNTGDRPQEVTDPMDVIASVREYLDVRPVARLADLVDAHDQVGETVILLMREREHRQKPTDFQRETARRLGRELP